MGNPLWSAGGQNLCDVFVLKDNATATVAATGYDVYDIFTTPGTPAKLSSPTTRTLAKPFTLRLTAATKPAPQDDGTLKVTFDNYDSQQEIFTLLDTIALPSTSAGKLPDVVLEDGYKKTSAGAAGFKAFIIPYLQKNEDVTPNEIFTNIAFGVISATSGAFETGGEKRIQPTFEFVGEKIQYPLTFAEIEDLFHSHASDPTLGLVSTTAVSTWAPSLATGECFKRKYLAIPAT